MALEAARCNKCVMARAEQVVARRRVAAARCPPVGSRRGDAGRVRAPCGSPRPSRRTDSHFNRASLSVGEPIGRVKRSFSVATGCSARLLRHFRAGTDARVAGCGQAGGREHEPARRRTPTSGGGGGGGYQLRRWSNSKAGAHWSSGSAAGSCSAAAAAHSGGPRVRCGRRGGRPRRKGGDRSAQRLGIRVGGTLCMPPLAAGTRSCG